jgi:phosphoribosylamine--glycine ligase/phosphoribosylglycinamide formyltransferase/phosphoribosylformylglycinamidine cyclo-ligase
LQAEVDAGAIIFQDTVPIHFNDTVEILEERVKAAEHKAYPEAVELLVRDKVRLGDNGKTIWNL